MAGVVRQQGFLPLVHAIELQDRLPEAARFAVRDLFADYVFVSSSSPDHFVDFLVSVSAGNLDGVWINGVELSPRCWITSFVMCEFADPINDSTGRTWN